MADQQIEDFFTELRDTHLSGVGVKETSYYPYLANLLTATGKKLKPRVRCIIHPRSIGAGLPDGATLSAGVQNASELNIDFDPSYQNLVIHSVVLIRDNKRIDEGDVFYLCDYELRFTYKR